MENTGIEQELVLKDAQNAKLENFNPPQVPHFVRIALSVVTLLKLLSLSVLNVWLVDIPPLNKRPIALIVRPVITSLRPVRVSALNV